MILRSYSRLMGEEISSGEADAWAWMMSKGQNVWERPRGLP
jgi:hypothetical protein